MPPNTMQHHISIESKRSVPRHGGSERRPSRPSEADLCTILHLDFRESNF
jgi:hypothetical protein